MRLEDATMRLGMVSVTPHGDLNRAKICGPGCFKQRRTTRKTRVADLWRSEPRIHNSDQPTYPRATNGLVSVFSHRPESVTFDSSIWPAPWADVQNCATTTSLPRGLPSAQSIPSASVGRLVSNPHLFRSAEEMHEAPTCHTARFRTFPVVDFGRSPRNSKKRGISRGESLSARKAWSPSSLS